MIGRQKAKLQMYRTVENVCTGNTEIIETNVAFIAAFNEFKDKIAAISQAAQLDDRRTTGITIDKNIAKRTLCQIAADVSSIISAYAATVGNNTLLKNIEYSVSTLLKMSEDTLPSRCQNIHEAGRVNLVELADYGLTNAHLTALQIAIDDFTAVIAKPRTAISQRKGVTGNLVELFKETDEILDARMDKLIIIFKTAAPDFVRTYESARRIINPLTTHTKLKGVVTDKLTETPINNAQITAAPTDPDEENPPQSTQTDENGEYEFNPIIVDDYTITATADGYQTFEEEEFHATLGDVNHFNIELVR